MAIALILGAAALFGVYLWVRLTRPDVQTLRHAMPGRLVHLSQGQTHCEWHGTKGGPVLVCVHGLSTASFVWGPLLPYLIGQGYHVLTYDLFGRGFSDRAPGRQDTRFFLRQLRDLLQAEGVTGEFTLIGYSMGGAIATAYAQAHPGRVDRLILLAPAGLGLALGRVSDMIARTPVIGDWVMEVLGARLLRRGYGDDDDAITTRALAELDTEGTLRAILSAQRGILSVDQAGLHGDLAATGLPVLAIWGGQDSVIPLTSRDRLTTLNPSARQITLPDTDHRLTYLQPAQVAEEIG